MRKFIIKYFALYERINANAYIFSGALLFLTGVINLILAGFKYLDVANLLIVAGLLLFSYGKLFARKGKYKSFRCGKFLAGTLLILGIIQIFNGQTFTFWTIFVLSLFAIEAFISFVYLPYWPPKWSEMDDEQRFDFYNGNFEGLNSLQQEYLKSIASKYQ